MKMVNLAFDFTLHTGDVSQNANRTFEVRDYLYLFKKCN